MSDRAFRANVNGPPPSEIHIAAANAGLTATVVTSTHEFGLIRPAWNALRRMHDVLAPHADPGGFVAALQSREHVVSPYIVSFQDGAEPRALIVSTKQMRSVVHRVGYAKLRTPSLRSLDVVYGGLIARDALARKAVCDFLEHILTSGEVEHVEINHLPADAPILMEIEERFGLATSADPPQIHHRFRFPCDSFEEALRGFSKKHRYNIRRMDRSLVEHFGGDVSVRKFAALEELDELVIGTAGIAAKTYQAGLGVGFADTPMWRAILHEEAEAGRLRAYWLVCCGVPIAFQIGSVYRGVYLLQTIGYLPVYRDLSPGTVLLLRVFQDLSTTGICVVDYGFGDADYKRTYGTESWEEVTVHLYGRSLRAYVARCVRCLAALASTVARRVVASTGLARIAKRVWRARLASCGDGGI